MLDRADRTFSTLKHELLLPQIIYTGSTNCTYIWLEIPKSSSGNGIVCPG